MEQRYAQLSLDERIELARLDTAAAALVYAIAITTMVKSELESRLDGESDELRRFRERYGMD
jgi:hypothetical protein